MNHADDYIESCRVFPPHLSRVAWIQVNGVRYWNTTAIRDGNEPLTVYRGREPENKSAPADRSSQDAKNSLAVVKSTNIIPPCATPVKSDD